MGIKINALDFDVSGEINLHGFLGLSDTIRPGYKNITVNVDLDADAPGDKLKELLEYAKKTSPVLDIITNPVPVYIKMN